MPNKGIFPIDPATEVGGVVYGLSCSCHPEEGVRYIGITRRDPRRRLAQHRSSAYQASKSSYDSPLYRWVRKHGRDRVQMEVIEECASEILGDREIHWISTLKTDRHSGGLNISPGGEHSSLTPETRAKIGAALSAAWLRKTDEERVEAVARLREIANMPRPPKSAEHREALSRAKLGKKPTSEARANMSRAWARHGRLPVSGPGEANGRCLSTEAEVREAYMRYLDGERQVDICRSLGKPQHWISNIVRKISWKWLTDQIDLDLQGAAA